MNPTLAIIFRLWRIQEEWEKLADPQWTWYGNMSFHNPNDAELARLVSLQEGEKELKKELRKKIGIWNYLRYTFNPVKFAKNLCPPPPQN